MDWHWFAITLVKTFVLAGPAVAVLAFWSRQGITSRVFYRVCWADLIGYVFWLVLVVVLGRLNESAVWRSRIPESAPADVFVFLPLLFALCSALTCVAAGISLKSRERGFAIGTTVLILVLWMSAVVAPN